MITLPSDLYEDDWKVTTPQRNTISIVPHAGNGPSSFFMVLADEEPLTRVVAIEISDDNIVQLRDIFNHLTKINESVAPDITADEARAKGYVKDIPKKEKEKVIVPTKPRTHKVYLKNGTIGRGVKFTPRNYLTLINWTEGEGRSTIAKDGTESGWRIKFAINGSKLLRVAVPDDIIVKTKAGFVIVKAANVADLVI